MSFIYIYIYIYTGCFVSCGHYRRKSLSRCLWSTKFLSTWLLISIFMVLYVFFKSCKRTPVNRASHPIQSVCRKCLITKTLEVICYVKCSQPMKHPVYSGRKIFKCSRISHSGLVVEIKPKKKKHKLVCLTRKVQCTAPYTLCYWWRHTYNVQDETSQRSTRFFDTYPA
jgi:hypothetical protein